VLSVASYGHWGVAALACDTGALLTNISYSLDAA
jgi:hypothetical protein